jgi:hypothetical protein
MSSYVKNVFQGLTRPQTKKRVQAAAAAIVQGGAQTADQALNLILNSQQATIPLGIPNST